MKKFVFDENTIHTLSMYSKQLYESFLRADRQIAENDWSWSSNESIDYSVNPHLYYNFRFGPYQLFIHKFKNGRYSLECRGFTPENLNPYDVNKYNIELYRNLFGNFPDFSSVSEAFADCVNQLTTFKVRSLF